MRRFSVYLDKNVSGCEPAEIILEFPNRTKQKDIDAACKDALDTLIANELCCGWSEVEP